MRVLFSFHPGFGHLFPLLPLARATQKLGHHVAFIGPVEFADVVPNEVPGGEYLTAGEPLSSMMAAAFGRDGFDLARPTPVMEANAFGAVRLEFAAEASVTAARAWVPDVLVAEEYDGLGPFLAAALHVPWYRHGVGPGRSNLLHKLTQEATGAYYDDQDALYAPPVEHLDPCPPTLKPLGWETDAPILPIRTEPHRGRGEGVPLPRSSGARERILVTFGTVSSDPDVLRGVVDQLRPVASEGEPLDLVVTKGLFLSADADAAFTDDDHIHFVGMLPMAELLAGVRLVVAAGGSGTVLAAAARGIPLVLFPQGADQHIVAERATSGGIAVTISDVGQLGPAVRSALTTVSLSAAARDVASEIAAAPSSKSVAARLFGSIN